MLVSWWRNCFATICIKIITEVLTRAEGVQKGIKKIGVGFDPVPILRFKEAVHPIHNFSSKIVLFQLNIIDARTT